MFHTAEVRWFRRGKLPATVQSWFSNCPGKTPSWEQRTDTYLMTHVDYVGMKIREGRLEVKFRTRRVRKREFLPKLTGTVENWTKVGFGDESNSLAATNAQPPGTRWLEVKKARLIRHYTQTDSGKIISLDAGAMSFSPTQLEVDDGCSLEITEIEILGGSWWSVGFEAFGVQESREVLLEAAVEYLGKMYDSPALQLQDSHGYPSWLTTL